MSHRLCSKCPLACTCTSSAVIYASFNRVNNDLLMKIITSFNQTFSQVVNVMYLVAVYIRSSKTPRPSSIMKFSQQFPSIITFFLFNHIFRRLTTSHDCVIKRSVTSKNSLPASCRQHTMYAGRL